MMAGPIALGTSFDFPLQAQVRLYMKKDCFPQRAAMSSVSADQSALHAA